MTKKNIFNLERFKERIGFRKKTKERSQHMTRVISRASIQKANDSLRNSTHSTNVSSEWVSKRVDTVFGPMEIKIEKKKIFEAADRIFMKDIK